LDIDQSSSSDGESVSIRKSKERSSFKQPLDAKAFIRGAIYRISGDLLLQNTLLYVALSNLSAPLFQVTYQSKLLATAVVSVIMLHRKYSLKQWVCLTTLGVGVAIVVLGESKGDDEEPVVEEDSDKPEQILSVGFTAVSVACLLRKSSHETNPGNQWRRSNHNKEPSQFMDA
jgi:UDP-sugar transporter A1/2/3